jgi:Dyp-type peroxidase family
MPVTSKNLRGVTELTLIADIKPGLVNVAEPIAYSGRLKALLGTLSKLRQASTEQSSTVPLVGALERLRTLHFFNWSLFDHDKRLLLTVAFDGPWEPYIRQIVELAGPLLDIIFCHCTGYEQNSCLAGYPRFSEWVRARQIESDFMYSAAPDLTVDDLRYLQQFERAAANKSMLPGQSPAILRAPDLNSLPSPASAGPLLAALGALFPLRRLFPTDGSPTASNDLFLFDRAVELFTRHLRSSATSSAPVATSVVGAAGATAADAALPPLLQWANALPSNRRKARERAAPQLQSPETLQGNILRRYVYGDKEPTHGCLVFLRFDSPADASTFLGSISVHLTADSQSGDVRTNLALTYQGLRTVGVPASLLSTFPKEFQEGMAQRAGLLGDVGSNHPNTWELLPRNWPTDEPSDHIELSSVDAVLTLQAFGPSANNDHEWSKSHPLYASVLALSDHHSKHGVHILHVQPLRRFAKSHFGLVDGISQPSPRRSPADSDHDSVALGELLLGYPNERNEMSSLPPDLAHNSTFLAIRKMAQDVNAFEEASRGDDVVKAKMLGRHPDGKPLVAATGANAFDYKQDPDGHACPLFSHIRRTNPRLVKEDTDGSALPTPRILRRGFPYGPESGDEAAKNDTERGVLFMAYCASIADQFEVVQSWVNGSNSTDAFSAHPDLIAGTFPAGSARAQTFVNADGFERLALPSKPISRLRWGLYLFVPSLRAIGYLVKLAKSPGRVALTTLVQPPAVEHLRTLESPRPEETAEQTQSRVQKARDEWRRFLEDPALRSDAAAIWKFVRDAGGALRTSYGVLVGSPDAVTQVLANEEAFSVREYWQRMHDSFGEHYLGMDRVPGPDTISEVPPTPSGYLRQSEIPNEFLSKIGYAEAFDGARRRTLNWFADQNGTADLRGLARTVISEIAQEWFGLPDFGAFMNADADPGPPIISTSGAPADHSPRARCPVDFLQSSQFIFRPNPTTALKEVATRRGRVIYEAAGAFLRQMPEKVTIGTTGKRLTLLETLSARNYEGDWNAALVGAINGFSVPTSSSLLSILDTWIETLELGRLRCWYDSLSAQEREQLGKSCELADFRKPLADALTQAFIQRPVPDLLHRTAVAATMLGDTKIHPGDRVVVSLASAAIAAQA